ncbi:MAG: SDR family NAD(P)-dependent oxidoreductase [Slackia sp.]
MASSTERSPSSPVAAKAAESVGVFRRLLKEGCNLAITGRNLQKLEDAKAELEEKYGVKVLPLQADGSDEEQVAAAVKKVAEEFGRIDFLINNAQNSASGLTLVEHSKEDLDKAIYSGIYAVFFYMKHCHPYLKETKGSVVNFASGAGLFGRFGQSSYAAAKEGIRGMTRVAATEWGPDGINCNVICPLVMTSQLAKWKEEYPEAYAKQIGGIPQVVSAMPKAISDVRPSSVLEDVLYFRRDHHHAGRKRLEAVRDATYIDMVQWPERIARSGLCCAARDCFEDAFGLFRDSRRLHCGAIALYRALSRFAAAGSRCHGFKMHQNASWLSQNSRNVSTQPLLSEGAPK